MRLPKPPTWADHLLLVIAAALLAVLLGGCGNDRDQQIANSAATIWEAAEAQDRGADPAATRAAIKANASAIATAVGSEYPPKEAK